VPLQSAIDRYSTGGANLCQCAAEQGIAENDDVWLEVSSEKIREFFRGLAMRIVFARQHRERQVAQLGGIVTDRPAGGEPNQTRSVEPGSQPTGQLSPPAIARIEIDIQSTEENAVETGILFIDTN